MKKITLILILITNTIYFLSSSYAANAKLLGVVNTINTSSANIKISNKTYTLSNTVKTYGLGGNKYIDIKNLQSGMAVEFKISNSKGKNTVSEIWVLPN